MFHEGEHTNRKRILNLEDLGRRLFERARDSQGLRVAFFGYTWFAARLVTELAGLLGDRFLPVCIIDNRRHGEPGPIKTCPVVSFEEAAGMAPQIDLVAVMVDGPSILEILGQLAESPLHEKELLVVHRDADPLQEREFAALCAEAQRHLTRNGVMWYTDEKNWFACYQYLKQTAALEGDIAEFGVFQGGSAWFMARVLRHLGLESNKTLWLFDTFEGIVQQSPLDLVETCQFSGSHPARVQALLVDFTNIRIVPGDVLESVSSSGLGRLSLAHVDCDQYAPTKFLCEALYDRMVPGGILMFQNYAFGATYGERVAVDAFFRDKPEAVLFGVDGAAFVVKH